MFYGFVITEAGNSLLASMVAGQTLTITKAVMGEGTADNAEAARKLTNLITPGPEATSTEPTVDGNNVNMIVEYRSDLNGGLQEGFWIGEFGIFGKVGNGAETMIGYGSLGDAKQYVSAYVPDTAPDVRRYPVSITVTSGAQVVIGYPAEAWMTAEDVDDKVSKHNSSGESHKDIRTALSNKVNKNTPIIWYDLQLQDGFKPSAYAKYGKDDAGWVQIAGAVTHSGGPLKENEVIAILPEGYRPSEFIPIPLIQSSGNWAIFGWIDTDGNIKLTSISPPNGFNQLYGISLGATFKAY